MGWRADRRIMREVGALRSLVEERLVEVVERRAGSTATVARLPITVAARGLIADVAAMLPLEAVRDGQRITPPPSLLVRPDPADGMTRRRFIHRAAMSLTGWGNVYLAVTTLGSNEWPLAVELIHPDTLSPIYRPGDPTRIVGWTYAGGTLDAEAVVHVPYLELDLEAIARSPLADCQEAFDDLAALWVYCSGYYRDGGKPPYLLKHPGRLNAQQATELIEQWVEARMAHRPGVLSGGLTLEDIPATSAADALLLDGLAYLDAQIARVYGITPTLLNVRVETGSLTYNNAEEEVQRLAFPVAVPVMAGTHRGRLHTNVAARPASAIRHGGDHTARARAARSRRGPLTGAGGPATRTRTERLDRGRTERRHGRQRCLTPC